MAITAQRENMELRVVDMYLHNRCGREGTSQDRSGHGPREIR